MVKVNNNMVNVKTNMVNVKTKMAKVKNNNTVNNIWIWLVFTFIAFVAVFVTLLSHIPTEYSFIWLLPLLFFIMSVIFKDIYKEVPSNLAVSIILVLLFCCTVVSPFLKTVVGEFSGEIVKNADENTLKAILLIAYETIAIFVFLHLKIRSDKSKSNLTKQYSLDTKIGCKRYLYLVFIVLAVLAACIIIAPELLRMYRTIFDINDANFTHYEDAFIVDQYGTTFIKKFALVTGRYIFNLALIIVPAAIIIFLIEKKPKFYRPLSFLFCLVPLFFISGAIATSLIYIVLLLLLRNKLLKRGNGRVLFILVVAGTFAISWWLLRAHLSGVSPLKMLASYSDSYFSGVNVVSGTFNLPNDFSYRIKYFLYDFLTTFPYGNTLFHIDDISVSEFFNLYNGSQGQIPPTIGMGYYYFGIFAPVYSLIFINFAYNAAKKFSTEQHPITYIRCIYCVFYLCMGVIMYNIEITLTNLFTVIVPMYIIERIALSRTVSKRNDT